MAPPVHGAASGIYRSPHSASCNIITSIHFSDSRGQQLTAMDREDAIQMFISITDAPAGVAEHVLDAHHWDLNNAVAFYLESGGVGHGMWQPHGGAGEAARQWEDNVPELIEDEEPARPAATAAAARPQSHPIPIEVPDDDDDLQILATSLGARQRSRAASAAGGPSSFVFGERQQQQQQQRVGSLEEEFEVGPAAGGGGTRRQRRNRPRGAGSVDRDLQLLGERFGAVHDEDEAFPAAMPSRLGRDAQPPAHPSALAHGHEADDDMPALPDDVDMEEQRMLMAALTGGAYEGALPDFNDPRFQARALSPGARERQRLREEQDAAYYESLQADMEREAAEARAKQEAEEAERAQREAEEAAQRRQQEEARRLERTISSKQAKLPPEPADGGEGVVNLMIRLPSGARIARRFHKSDALQSVFDFIDVQRLEGMKPHTYHLVMQYPRKTFEEYSELTLAEAGLSAKQEALYLELK